MNQGGGWLAAGIAIVIVVGLFSDSGDDLSTPSFGSTQERNKAGEVNHKIPHRSTEERRKRRGRGAGERQSDAEERSGGSLSGVPTNARQTTVRSVTDGDTVVLAGLGDSRLIGVDTPETYSGTECYGPEASDFTTSRLSGATVYIVRGNERVDQYGRDLVYVWLAGGTFFNAELVKQGYAEPLSIAPNTDYASLFSRLARGARSSDRGLWGRCGDADTPVPGSGEGDAGGGSGSGGGACDSNYDPCVPAAPPDLDCADIDGPVTVTGEDVHRFDADGDGTGCD
jgi:micrococcal nuclease